MIKNIQNHYNIIDTDYRSFSMFFFIVVKQFISEVIIFSVVSSKNNENNQSFKVDLVDKGPLFYGCVLWLVWFVLFPISPCLYPHLFIFTWS